MAQPTKLCLLLFLDAIVFNNSVSTILITSL